MVHQVKAHGNLHWQKIIKYTQLNYYSTLCWCLSISVNMCAFVQHRWKSTSFFLFFFTQKPNQANWFWSKEYWGWVTAFKNLQSVIRHEQPSDLWPPQHEGAGHVIFAVMGFEGRKAKGNPSWWQHVRYSWSHQCEPTKKHQYQILPVTDVGSIILYYINDNLIEFSEASPFHSHLLDKISLDWIWRWETQSDP